MPKILAFIKEECERQRTFLSGTEKEGRKDMTEMDECFARMVMGRQ